MVKIRLARHGRTKAPMYSIVVMDSRGPREGAFLEKVGNYNPKDDTKPFRDVKVESIKTWMGKGALLSESLKSLFKKYQIQLS